MKLGSEGEDRKEIKN